MENVIAIAPKEQQCIRQIQVLKNKRDEYYRQAEDSRFVSATGDYSRVDDYNFYLSQADYFAREVKRLESQLNTFGNVCNNAKQSVYTNPVIHTVSVKRTETKPVTRGRKSALQKSPMVPTRTNYNTTHAPAYRSNSNKQGEYTWLWWLIIICALFYFF